MDLRRPLAVVTPTLDGDVLALLAAGDVKLTGREISRRIGVSQEGVRRVLERLVGQGIVMREQAGKAHLHRLNRKHIAAPMIQQLAGLRQAFIGRLRDDIERWSIPPTAAVLFGSFARGDAEEGSDIDILVVRPGLADPDEPVWRRQLVEMSSNATEMTGNDARIVEYSVVEARRPGEDEGPLASARREGIELAGSLGALRSRRRTSGRRKRALGVRK